MFDISLGEVVYDGACISAARDILGVSWCILMSNLLSVVFVSRYAAFMTPNESGWYRVPSLPCDTVNTVLDAQCPLMPANIPHPHVSHLSLR